MLWLKILGGLVVVVVGYVLVAGSVVVRTHVASARVALKRPPVEVWAAITDHAAQTTWRADLKSIEMLAPQDGKITFRETTSFGPVRYVVDESDVNRRYVTRILDTELGYAGRWIFELASAGAGTVVTITEEGEVKSLMFRALSPFFSKTATIEAYLKALAAKFAETATPEVVRKA